ncbi:MAG TPA: PPC domain-containing DNA-binding protein [Candidatus Eisenbacteria bacterium]|nr:PPC domain-containing DNA-binding protein [Candidatus Eisenbacteria bacterium]
MESQRTRYGWALKIEPGEEIFATIQSFAKSAGLRAGAITAIGAVGDTELGFFVPASKTYVRRTFEGDHEILALTGNLSELEGQPFPHCHLILAGEDFVAYGGHLFRAVVTVTCEVQIVTDPGRLLRVTRPDLGFNPLQLGDRS